MWMTSYHYCNLLNFSFSIKWPCLQHWNPFIATPIPKTARWSELHIYKPIRNFVGYSFPDCSISWPFGVHAYQHHNNLLCYKFICYFAMGKSLRCIFRMPGWTPEAVRKLAKLYFAFGFKMLVFLQHVTEYSLPKSWILNKIKYLWLFRVWILPNTNFKVVLWGHLKFCLVLMTFPLGIVHWNCLTYPEIVLLKFTHY